MFALLWLFLIMPQRRRAARPARAALTSVEVGDEILTVGGLIGHVRSAQGEELGLEIAPGTKVRVARRSVASVLTPGHGGRQVETASPQSRGASPQLTYRPLVNRRPHLTLVALIVAGLIGVGLLAIPGSPIHQKPTLGLDLQGGLEVTLQAVPPPNRQAAEVRPHAVGRDPARPHRPARRRGARDPGAGRRPDLDPDPRHQEPRRGDRDPRPDGAARALRPRGEPRAAFDRRRATSRSRRSRSTRCSPASRPLSTRRRASPGTSSTTRRRSAPAR